MQVEVGSTADWATFQPVLDGDVIGMNEWLEFDTDAGYVVVMELDAEGKPQVDDDGNVRCKRLNGTVTVERVAA